MWVWRDCVVPLDATVSDLNFSDKLKQFLPAFTSVEVWVTDEKSSKGITVLVMPLAYIQQGNIGIYVILSKPKAKIYIAIIVKHSAFQASSYFFQ